MLRRTNSLPAKRQDGLLNLRRSRRILGRFLPKLWRHREVPPFFSLGAGESTGVNARSESQGALRCRSVAHPRFSRICLGQIPWPSMSKAVVCLTCSAT